LGFPRAGLYSGSIPINAFEGAFTDFNPLFTQLFYGNTLNPKTSKRRLLNLTFPKENAQKNILQRWNEKPEFAK